VRTAPGLGRGRREGLGRDKTLGQKVVLAVLERHEPFARCRLPQRCRRSVVQQRALALCVRVLVVSFVDTATVSRESLPSVIYRSRI
jgi:hypothetical protein